MTFENCKRQEALLLTCSDRGLTTSPLEALPLDSLFSKSSLIRPPGHLTPGPADPAQAPPIVTGVVYQPSPSTACSHTTCPLLPSLSLCSLPSCRMPIIYPGQAHLLPSHPCPGVTLEPFSLRPWSPSTSHKCQLCLWFLLPSPAPHLEYPGPM